MTRKFLLFTKLKESRTKQVTFGDSVKGKVIGKGHIDHPRDLNT